MYKRFSFSKFVFYTSKISDALKQIRRAWFFRFLRSIRSTSGFHKGIP